MANDDGKSKVLERLVELIISTANFEATWIRFLLVLQGGLAAAMWAVAAYAAERRPAEESLSSEESLSLVILSVLIPFFGVVMCTAITIIHVRIGRWAGWYILGIHRLGLPETMAIFPQLPPGYPTTAKNLNELPIGDRGRVMVGVNMLILIAWVVVAAVRLWSACQEAWVLAPPASVGIIAIVIVWWKVRQRPVQHRDADSGASARRPAEDGAQPPEQP